jgi:hypothetical protein
MQAEAIGDMRSKSVDDCTHERCGIHIMPQEYEQFHSVLCTASMPPPAEETKNKNAVAHSDRLCILQ